jgi:hypothetical protein
LRWAYETRDAWRNETRWNGEDVEEERKPCATKLSRPEEATNPPVGRAESERLDQGMDGWMNE